MSINLYFVRHGQTYLNKYHRIQGVADTTLTEKGIDDAINAGKRLSKIKFDQAYSSDSPRAIKTGQIILRENPADIKEPTIETAFREENFGYFEGNDDANSWHMIGGPYGKNTFNDIIAEFTIEGSKDMIANADPYHDAENNDQFWKRLQPGIDKVIANAKDGDNILVASHGTLIRSMVSKYDKSINVAQSTLNGSVTKFVWDGSKMSVAYFNNVTDEI
ncbi:histidine phosphatase family protein [Lentilactobacillus laojiaonis]|uniref:histidine phosphatase family protein n=1 Tax=Lentilactobacillus laojiaonis TaxID=2883998 RepID=UPI001D0A723B|nr:histidine phosphatase family protein [Lentilactobacillus laojiaonis]UDM32329.1 histidine phosphatase family protein [Lentilactobacillus laojiaonis]